MPVGILECFLQTHTECKAFFECFNHSAGVRLKVSFDSMLDCKDLVDELELQKDMTSLLVEVNILLYVRANESIVNSH